MGYHFVTGTYHFVTMRPHSSRNSDQTVPVGTLSNLPALIEELGFDGTRLMADYGLSAASFVRPMQPVPVSLSGALIADAVELTGCAHLPVLLGARARLQNVGPLRLLIADSPSVRVALAAIVRYSRVWYSGLRLFVTEDKDVASLVVTPQGEFRGRETIATAYLMALTRHLETIVGPAWWRILEVQLSASAPQDKAPYRRNFGVTPKFGQQRDAVFFPAKLLDIRRPMRDPGVHEFLRKQIDEMASAAGSEFVDQVSELVETLLMGGSCSVERVCDVLGMHRFTLYRRLRKDGATFEALLDGKRHTLAEGMLARGGLTVSEIAAALGYSSPTNFTRAFRRWSGVAPAHWQQRHRRRSASS